MKKLKIILSGGGTGGHIFPAIAIANEIRKMVPDSEILFVGALGRMEMEKVPAAGYEIRGVPIAGLQRRLTLANLKLPFLIVKSLLKTRAIIKEFKPDVAVGTGGYASGPLLRAAAWQGVPVLIQEQNSYAGITNKLLSKKASVICVAYEGMEKFFPKERIMLTGNPVRQDLVNVRAKKQEALTHFKLDPAKKVLLVIGGSGGARTVNEAILGGIEQFESHQVQVLWQTGRVYFQAMKTAVSEKTTKHIFVNEFISRMDLAYAAADLVVSRAGASSVSELCNLGLPCILVPSPNVAEDHQTKNAMALVNKKAAVLVKDKDARQSLVPESIALITNDSKKEELSTNIQKMAFPDSASVIARAILRLAGHHQS